MQDFLLDILSHPFTWGLIAGLVLCVTVWRSGHVQRSEQKREIKRLNVELADLNKHLGQQLKITAAGNDTLNAELESLREKNENLRVSIATLQQKPGKAEARLLQVYDRAVHLLLELAPGFAPAWEAAIRDAEAHVADSESGLTKLVRRVTRPALSAPTTQTTSSQE